MTKELLLQQAKAIWPGLTVMEIDLILWSCTQYPAAPDEEVLADLKDAYNKSGGDLWIALDQADQQHIQAVKSGA